MKTVGLLAMTLVVLALAAASAEAAPATTLCTHGTLDDPACVGNSIPNTQPAAGRWNQTDAVATIDDSQVLSLIHISEPTRPY